MRKQFRIDTTEHDNIDLSERYLFHAQLEIFNQRSLKQIGKGNEFGVTLDGHLCANDAITRCLPNPGLIRELNDFTDSSSHNGETSLMDSMNFVVTKHNVTVLQYYRILE